ncbi:MAG TPA: glycosyltransferase family 2 protein [Candidatus Dormibacteraeota bacterium]|nr:glycosyltransferase family 2 protein [Candidatus Dormibacteraeota bacterium]
MVSRPRADGAPPVVSGEHPAVSIVIPLFNEEETLPLLHERVRGALEGLGRSYEIVYVDDGSSDGTFQRLTTIAHSDPHIRVVQFRRNFGQTAALQAGIDYSRGETLVFMDGDLQNDPADIGRLLARLEQGYDVVSGWRKHRKDPFTRRLPSRIANALISRITGVELHDYGCTLKAYRREVIESVRLYGEMHRFIPAYAAWAGASVSELEVDHHPRRFGKSKYGLSRTLRVVLDLMTAKFLGSFSSKPNYLFGTIAFVSWTLALLAGVVVLIEKLLPPHPEAHNNPLLLLAVFLAIVGVQFLLMGLLAELGVRTYHESQGKPTYVVRQVVAAGLNPEAGNYRSRSLRASEAAVVRGS